jgi:hypothetical protein
MMSSREGWRWLWKERRCVRLLNAGNQYFIALIDPSWRTFPQFERAIKEEELYSTVSPIAFLVAIFHGCGTQQLDSFGSLVHQ